MSAPNSNYQLVWSDEFSTMSISSDRADTSKNWWHTVPGSSYFGDAPFRAPNHQTQPFAIEQKGGETALKITMDKNPTTGQLESGLISTFYHDGTSHDKLDGDPYGYYEARLWLPEGNGTWPAFWSLESERLKPAAERDHVIEVDVMEHHGNTPTSYASVIHDWNWDNGTVVSGSTGPYHRNVVGDDVMTHGWHTYGVEVTKEKMNFYMDGKLHWSYDTPTTYTMDPMFMINLAAGGNWSIDPNLNNVSMWVDYFRHYEKMPGTTPTDPAPTPTPTPEPTPSPSPVDPALDTITVRISGTDYNGDPNFAFLVDGKIIDTTNLVTADHKAGQWQTFTFTGDFDAAGTQSHRVGIKFDNNLSGSGGDRNVYVDEVTFNGQVNTRDQALTMNGTKYWDFVL